VPLKRRRFLLFFYYYYSIVLLFCTLWRIELCVLKRRVRVSWRGVVLNTLGPINEVNQRRARLVLGWVTICKVTSHPGQLSLAIPQWVGAMSTSESGTPHDALARSVYVVRQCKLVSGWGLMKRRSAPSYGPCFFGTTLLWLRYVMLLACVVLWFSFSFFLLVSVLVINSFLFLVSDLRFLSLP